MTEWRAGLLIGAVIFAAAFAGAFLGTLTIEAILWFQWFQ